MKIVIAGNYGAKNLGDEMILEGLLTAFKSIAPHAEITVLSADPVATAALHNINSLKQFPAGFRSFLHQLRSSKNIKAVKNCDYFVLGGGGLFSNLTLKAYLIWGIQASMAYFYKKPVIMYGQSVGPFRNKIQQRIVKKLFKKARFVAVRDESSKETLKDLDIGGKIYVIPDLIFRLKSPSATKREKKIIIALRQMPNLSPEFKARISNFFNWLIEEKKYHLKFAAFQLPHDEQLNAEILQNIRQKAKVSHMPHFHNAEGLLKHFAAAEFVIGMRLHSVLSAIKSSTPFMALDYAPKVRDFLKYAKLSDLVVPMDEENLQKKFTEILADSDKIIARLQAFNEKAEKRHLEVERDFASLELAAQ